MLPGEFAAGGFADSTLLIRDCDNVGHADCVEGSPRARNIGVTRGGTKQKKSLTRLRAYLSFAQGLGQTRRIATE